ncbi:hypothetical protein F0310_03765 [Borrelia sp. A-FGy1]|uniref:hypothetical protein n=1 Tax=Borrelia sp. A-FGy1 TaxID=2608247 RepID=UPI0015F60D7D|nr:hypothetical protein [Borrelia sp. A-FGy1]QMU99503.1 hypothetical protein F0310_03765 [Borrelia sp. A-FGy1]
MSNTPKNYSITILITIGIIIKVEKTIVKSLNKGKNIIFIYHLNENEKINLKNLKKYTKAIKYNLLNKKNNSLFNKTLDLNIHNKIDVLINNAPIFKQKILINFNSKRFNKNLQINNLEILKIGKQFLKQKIKKLSITNILDLGTSYYNKNYFEYNLYKKLISNVTKELKYEKSLDDIVNGIAKLTIKNYRILLNENPKKINLLFKFENSSDTVRKTNFLIKSKFITGKLTFINRSKV